MEQSRNEGLGIFDSQPDSMHANSGSETNAVIETQSTGSRKFATKAVATTLGLTLAVGLYEVSTHNNDTQITAAAAGSKDAGNNPAESRTVPVSDEAKKACKTISFTETAADATEFPGRSITGERQVSSVKDAEATTRGFFGEKGIFAGRANMPGFASVVSLVVVPALSKEFDPKRDVNKDIQAKIAAYKAENGTQVAREDCEHLFDALTTTVSYESPAIFTGQKLGQAIPEKNGANETVNAKMTNVPVGNLVKQDATVYKINEAATNAGYNAFTTVLINDPGEVFVEGEVTQTAGDNAVGTGAKPSPSPTPSPESGKANNTQNGQTAGGVTGGTNGTTGNTGVTTGTTPEKNAGPAGGNTTGTGTTKEGTTGGKGNTPAGGGGGGGGNASPTPTPGNTPPPVVVVVPSKLPTPKPTDTFIPPPPTASPTPKGTEPPCISNPPYVIC